MFAANLMCVLLSIESNSIRIGGPADAIVTKVSTKLSQGWWGYRSGGIGVGRGGSRGSWGDG